MEAVGSLVCYEAVGRQWSSRRVDAIGCRTAVWVTKARINDHQVFGDPLERRGPETDVPTVFLAAGEGRRLEPLTNRRPKPMVPVANRPILEHVIEATAAAGIDRIVLVVGYRQERIRNHFGDGDDWGVTIEYVEQATQLGTAHAVDRVREHVQGPFVVLNGDQIVDSELIERVRDELRTAGGPVVSVTRSEPTSEYGIVTLEGETVTGIEEKLRAPTTSELINAGVYGFDRWIFEAISRTPT